jgi:hypothetical protein
LDRIGADGIQVLAPYLQDPSADNVLKLVDTFRRSGRDVVFTRAVTQLEETSIPIEKADVNVTLTFHDTGAVSKRSFYDSDLKATYVFRNPLTTPAKGRFRFALPETGTLSGFDLAVNGQSVGEPDKQGAYTWAGLLEPGQTATAVVRYHTQGGGVWRYDIGSGRRRIQAFTLTVDANERSRMIWQLGNVITNQHVDLFFPGRGAWLESRSKALGFLPISLAVFLAGVAFVAWRQHRPLEPGTLTLATVGFVIGLGAVAIALEYMPLTWAVIVSAVVGSGLALRVLGPRYIAPAGLAAILPLAFTSELHSGLIVLLALGLGFLAILGRRPAVG